MKKANCAAFFLFVFVSATPRAEVASLCEPKERTVWSCQAGKKAYSVCASKDLTDSAGYLQYRAGKPAKAEFRFPAGLQHPKGHFEFNLQPHGATLSFNSGKYSYIIGEDLKGDPVISVAKADHTPFNIRCRESTHSLVDTSTINLFTSAGVAQ